MQTTRLNKVLERQKRTLKLDVLLAVLFVIGLGLATIAFVTTAPSLAPRTVDTQDRADQISEQTPAQITATLLEDRPNYMVR